MKFCIAIFEQKKRKSVIVVVFFVKRAILIDGFAWQLRRKKFKYRVTSQKSISLQQWTWHINRQRVVASTKATTLK